MDQQQRHRRIKKLIASGAIGGGGNPYAAYMTGTIVPKLWYQFRETTGTNAVNSGSVGATLDGTYSNATLGQTGQLGANQAASWNATTTFVTTPNDASINALQAFTYGILVNPTTAGESSNGSFWQWNAAVAHAGRFNAALTSIQFILARAGGSNLLRTSTGLTAGVWAWLFFTADAAAACHVYKGAAGAVTEYSYSTNSPQAGAITTTSLLLYTGNNSSNAATFDGPIDEFFIVDRVLTPTEMLQLVTLSGL